MKKLCPSFFFLFAFLISNAVSAQNITWIGDEYTDPNLPGSPTIYKGDQVKFQIQSYPIGTGQEAQLHIDWNNDGYGGSQNEDWYIMPWLSNSSSNSYWETTLPMKYVGNHKRKYIGYPGGAFTVDLG